MWVITNYLGLVIDATEHVGGSLISRVLRHKLSLHCEVENLGFYKFNRFL